MSERIFRLIMGVLLWASLILSAIYETMTPVYCFVGLVLFEGVTNWRIPIIISRIRYGKNYKNHVGTDACSRTIFFNKFEAERILRFIVAIFVMSSFYIAPDFIWFMPWFVAGMLILAGITNICPMVMFLRWAGLR